MPNDYAGMCVDDAGRQLRDENRAPPLALVHEGKSVMNPAPDFVITAGDQALVVAVKSGSLKPVRVENVKP